MGFTVYMNFWGCEFDGVYNIQNKEISLMDVLDVKPMGFTVYLNFWGYEFNGVYSMREVINFFDINSIRT